MSCPVTIQELRHIAAQVATLDNEFASEADKMLARGRIEIALYRAGVPKDLYVPAMVEAEFRSSFPTESNRSVASAMKRPKSIFTITRKPA